MDIPKNLDGRESFYSELIRKCTATQQERSANYALLRHFYLFGRGPSDDETPYNKIYPHIDTLTSFLFAAETTKFSIHLGPHTPEVEYLRIKTLNKAVNDAWLLSNADQVFMQALTWSLVYPSTFIKLIVRGGEIFPFMVDPGSFGVLREDLPFADRQEAMVHSYYTTRSQLEIDIKDHPNSVQILDNVQTSQMPQGEQPSGIQRLLLTAATPNMTGNVNTGLDSNIDYVPKVDEELVRMHELWVWDTKDKDYRVVTITDGGMTIYDRKNFFLKGEHPFVHVCPNPMYSYFWGMSEVAGMIGLQKWRNERVVEVKKLLNRQVNPPTALTGWTGIMDEIAYAAFNEGSVLSTDSFQAKVERFAPQIPQEIFAVIHEIDTMFSERSGLQNILMGKGEVGVRSGRQTSELARLSSARIRKRALVIEDALEAISTLYLKCMMKYDSRTYTDEEGNSFVPDQFAREFVVKVDAHSNSPLFIEDQKAIAAEMLQAGVINKERFVEMISPQDKELIIRELKVIEEKEAAAAKAQQQAKQQEEAAKKLK